jgi:non-specific serine/threonine protein kinase/serine/threonine-protein kinase
MQTCDAVTHAHQKGIIHRDLKPSNVLVTDVDGTPRAKIIDFGIAKLLSDGTEATAGLTAQTMLIGTPEYMSPEQASGRQQLLDTRTDVYALGVLLYELLTGALPLSSETLRNAPLDETLRMIREAEPRRLSTAVRQHDPQQLALIAAQRGLAPDVLHRKLRGELEWIPLKALRKSPDQRYQSPGELLEAGPESTSYVVQKFLYRHRGKVAAAAAVAISVVAGAVGTSLMAWRAADARDVAMHQEQLATEARDAAVKQRQLAETEARVSEAMNRFLLDMLQQATPQISGSKEITVAYAVEFALAELDNRFADQPRVRFRLREVLSGVLDDLGRTAEAAPGLRRAVVEATELLGADDPTTLGLRNELASLTSNLGDIPGAEPLYRELLASCERVYGPRHRRTLGVVCDLATTLRQLGRFDESEVLYRRALQGQRALLGPGHRRTLVSLVGLADARMGQGDESAIDMMREAYELSVEHLGADDADTLATADSYASMLWELDRAAEAEEIFVATVAGRKQLLGPQHPDTLASLANYAMTLDAQNRSEQAEPLLREAYDGFRQHFGLNHLQTISVGNNLGTILELIDLPDEAAEIYRELIPACETTLGEGHFLGMMIAGNLGTLREAQGNLREAEKILAATLKKSQMHLGLDHQLTKKLASQLARVRTAMSRL